MPKVEPVDFILKGWGHEIIVANSEKYCGKILFIAAGKKMSWHKHGIKEEHFYCFSGNGVVREQVDREHERWTHKFMKAGDIWHIRPGILHQVISHSDLYLVEFSTQHFEEDSIRIEKGD